GPLAVSPDVARIGAGFGNTERVHFVLRLGGVVATRRVGVHRDKTRSSQSVRPPGEQGELIRGAGRSLTAAPTPALPTLLRIAGVHNGQEVLGLSAGGAGCAVDIRHIDGVDQTGSLILRNQVGVAGDGVGWLALRDVSAVQLTRFETGFGIADGRVLQIKGNVEAIRPGPDSGPVGKVVIV